MTFSRRDVLKYSTILGAATLVGTPSFAAGARWDMADEYGAQSLTGQACKFFIDELKKKVGDALQITYQGGGALGYKSADHFDAVEDGAVQIAITLLTQLGGIDPLFNLTSLPFMARSPEEALLLWKTAKPEYSKIFEDHDMKLLWAMPNAPSGIHAKLPITSVDAIKGLRIRTYDVNGTQTLVNAGASPLQISWGDLIPQLSTGGIDAVLTSADGGMQLSIWDYVSDFTEINYAMGLFVCHVNKPAFDALPEDVQQAIMDICDECDTYSWKIVVDSIEKSYKVLSENGMTITYDDDVPNEVFDLLQNAGKPVREEWLAQTGEKGKTVLDAFEAKKSS
nr:TRAP transporter substrate-binding protein [uncultured Cohaesibacter sp.]